MLRHSEIKVFVAGLERFCGGGVARDTGSMVVVEVGCLIGGGVANQTSEFE